MFNSWRLDNIESSLAEFQARVLCFSRRKKEERRIREKFYWDGALITIFFQKLVIFNWNFRFSLASFSLS